MTMRFFSLSVLICLLVGMLFSWNIAISSPLPQEQLVAGYVSGHQETGFTTNRFAAFSRLSGLFNGAGAVVREISLARDISPEIDVVILGGPKQPAVSDAEVGRLWNYIENGGSVLILNDPAPNQGLTAGNPLNNLLWEDYGIRWREDLLVEEWFTAESSLPTARFGILNQPERYTALHAAAIPGHALTQLLTRHNLPVYYWHARSLQLQAPALKGSPIALLRTRGLAFGETQLNQQNPRLNYGQDTPPGEIILGAAVEDFTTRARIVVLGDSELFKDGYGLGGINGQLELPNFAGNDVFARSIIQWLLRLPMGETALPELNLWVAVDGSAAEWENVTPVYTAEPASDTTDLLLTSIRFAKSDRRLYTVIDAVNIPYPIDGFILRSVDNNGNAHSISLEVDGTIQAEFSSPRGTIPAYGIELVMGDVIELSLPLQSLPVGIGYTITDVCIVSGTPICVSLDTRTLVILGAEPRGRNLLAGFATARISNTNGVALRETPNGNPLITIEFNGFVNVLGRDQSGVWVKVWVDGMIGWMDSRLMEFPYSIDTYVERDIIAPS